MEKRLFKRKILLILVIIMNEFLIYFLGNEQFLDFKVSMIGNVMRVILAIMIIFSIFGYFKEKTIEVEVKKL